MNYEPITIRLATQEDAALIADLSRRTFYETFAAENTKEDMDKFMSEQFSRQGLIDEVGTPGNVFFLAFDKETPVGYVRMRESTSPPELGDSPAIELARIYATQDAIGKGVGKSLMQQCLHTAKEMNKEVIWLGVWEHNHRAIDFYTKWGFEKFAGHDFILGNDVQHDWLMKKMI